MSRSEEHPTTKVLIAIDASERSHDALALGALLARTVGAPVVLATAFPYDALAQDPSGGAETGLREEARETLLESGRGLEGVSVADALVVASNSPARALYEMTEAGDVGLIVVGSTHRGPLGRVLPGSVGERLLSGAGGPVAVAPHGYAQLDELRLREIGVAYDASSEAKSALQGAVALARLARAGLRIVMVHQPVAFGSVPVGAGLGQTSANRWLREERRQQLDQAVAGVPDEVPAEGVLCQGDAAERLGEQSHELDLLVTGSRGYGPLGAVLLGGTTHALLHAAACPLVVLPRGVGLDIATGAVASRPSGP